MGSAVPRRFVVGGFDEVRRESVGHLWLLGRRRVRPGYPNCSAGIRVCYRSAALQLTASIAVLRSSTVQVPVAQHRRLINNAPSTTFTQACMQSGLSLIFLSFSSTYHTVFIILLVSFHPQRNFPPSLPRTQNKIYSPNVFLSSS
ncbi:hypothetical protein HOY82DRAFT_577772 [Tuber indicum]|nr:hypothetical protein HOY82DRAFT_577772 [Tuber indicum]